MKNPNARDWVIDSVVVVCLTGIAVFFLPWLSACFAAISLLWDADAARYLGITFFCIYSFVLIDSFPHIIIGCLLGLTAAWLIRHRKLSLALLPSVLLSVFYVLFMSFGLYPYPWGQVLRLDFVIVGDWLLLLTASFLCARFILRRRQPNTALEPAQVQAKE